MKKQVKLVLLSALVCCTLFCAFTFESRSSLKSLTHPYINAYECTYARLGNVDLLEKYEYFKITFLDAEELEISFKKKEGNVKKFESAYTYSDESGELQADIGILGFKFRQKTIIKNGKFDVRTTILGMPLIMKFEVK